MVTIEITHNGKRLYVAGHENAESLQVNLFHELRRGGYATLMAHADVVHSPEFRQSLLWTDESNPIRVGDRVELCITDGLTPDLGRVSSSFGKRISGEGQELFCSFCGKSQHAVKKLIAGPRVFICDECILVCNEVLEEKDTPA